MLRLFTCIWIPNYIKEKIQELQKNMIKLPIEAKFVKPDNLHITLSFIGNVNKNKLKLINKELDNITKNVKKFNVRLEGLKIIPNENHIRLIGIEAIDTIEFANLIKSIGNKLNGKYHEKTKLTLCRVKNIINKGGLGDFIEKKRNIKIGEFQVKSVALVKSTLTRNGPIYETIYTSFLHD